MVKQREKNRKKYRLWLKLLAVGCLSMSLACTGNLFSGFADKGSDEALLFEAKQSLDQSDFNGAIDFIELMSAAGQAERQEGKLA